MTRYSKSEDGKYHIKGQKYDVLVGSRAQVWHGTAFKTSGELKKSDLIKNKNDRIVSKAKHTTAKKEKRLLKHGYGTKKGKFGFVKLGKSRKMRGGSVYGSSLSPTVFKSDGKEMLHSSTDVQFSAGMAGGAVYGSSFSPASFKNDGQEVPHDSNDVQFRAGMAGGSRRRRRSHRK